jgi:hypothetical protein
VLSPRERETLALGVVRGQSRMTAFHAINMDWTPLLEVTAHGIVQNLTARTPTSDIFSFSLLDEAPHRRREQDKLETERL